LIVSKANFSGLVRTVSFEAESNTLILTFLGRTNPKQLAILSAVKCPQNTWIAGPRRSHLPCEGVCTSQQQQGENDAGSISGITRAIQEQQSQSLSSRYRRLTDLQVQQLSRFVKEILAQGTLESKSSRMCIHGRELG
jgi:hypothetical protein